MMNHSFRATLLILLALPSPAIAADANKGQAIFTATCARCHTSGPAGLKTPPEQLAETLRNSRTSQHRFKLGESDLADVAACAAASKSVQQP